MASIIDLACSRGRILQSKSPLISESWNALSKEAVNFIPHIRSGALLSETHHHTKDGDRSHQTELSPFGPIIKNGYSVHLWLADFIERVDLASLILSTLKERNQDCSIFLIDLRGLGDALNCMSIIFASIEGPLWDQQLRKTAWESEQSLQTLFQVLPRNLSFVPFENLGDQELLRNVAVWASNEGELRHLQSELHNHVKVITSRLEVVKSDYHDQFRSEHTTLKSAGQLAVKRNLVTDAITDDASTTTYRVPSTASMVTKLSSMSSYANDANEFVIADHSGMYYKSTGSSAASAASLSRSSPSDSEFIQYRRPDADPNKSRPRNELSALWRERSVNDDEKCTGCKELKIPGDEKAACATCLARDIVCVGCSEGGKRQNPSSGPPSTCFRRLSDKSEVFLPSFRNTEMISECEEKPTCVGPDSDAKLPWAGDGYARLGDGASPSIEQSSRELCSTCAKRKFQTTSQEGIAGYHNSYAMTRWLGRRNEEPWNPLQATEKCSSCSIARNSGSSGRVDLQQSQVHAYGTAGRKSHIYEGPAPGSSLPSERDSLVALFECLSFRFDGYGKRPSIQPVVLANEARQSPTPPNGRRDNSDPSDNIRGKRKASERSENSEDCEGDSRDRGDPDKPDKKKKKHPRNFEGYLPCIYRVEALHLECSKVWPCLEGVRVHLMSTRHEKTRKQMNVKNWGTEVERWKRLYTKLQGKPAPNPYDMNPKISGAAKRRPNDDPYRQYGQNGPSEQSDRLKQNDVSFRQLSDKDFGVGAEDAAHMARCVTSQNIVNTHMKIPFGGKVNASPTSSAGPMIVGDLSNGWDHNIKDPLIPYLGNPIEPALNEWCPDSTTYAPISEPQMRESISEESFPWNPPWPNDSLSEVLQLDAELSTDAAYTCSDATSQSLVHSHSGTSRTSTATSFPGTVTEWEEWELFTACPILFGQP